MRSKRRKTKLTQTSSHCLSLRLVGNWESGQSVVGVKEINTPEVTLLACLIKLPETHRTCGKEREDYINFFRGKDVKGKAILAG